MRITVNEGGGKPFRLRLPSGLVLNRASAVLLSAALKDKNIDISDRQLRILFRAVREYQKLHPEWKLLEVHSRGGERVEIVL